MTVLGLAGFALGQGHTPDLKKGLVFLYERYLIVTGYFWNVVVNLDLKWHRSQLNYIDSVLDHIDRSQRDPRMQSVTHYVNWQEITYLHAVWNELHRELEDVENLLPRARHKRGLLNFGGHVLNFFCLAQLQAQT
jgi:hypothetical protein